LSERIGSTLREYGRQARTIGLQIRYADHFSARQTARLTRPSNDARELCAEAKELFAQLFTRHVAVQTLGVNITSLETDYMQGAVHGCGFAQTGAQPFESQAKRAASLQKAASC
jgi:nucleotidyltransferase/DNA polymerase involved in DNA repair